MFVHIIGEASTKKERDVFCQYDGVDIPSGAATIVGIKAKKSIHLPHPYTDCTSENKEYHFMLRNVLNDTDKLQQTMDEEKGDFFRYNAQHCR